MRTGSRLQVTELYFGAFGTNCNKRNKRQLKKSPAFERTTTTTILAMTKKKKKNVSCITVHLVSAMNSINRLAFSVKVNLLHKNQNLETGGKRDSTYETSTLKISPLKYFFLLNMLTLCTCKQHTAPPYLHNLLCSGLITFKW